MKSGLFGIMKSGSQMMKSSRISETGKIGMQLTTYCRGSERGG